MAKLSDLITRTQTLLSLYGGLNVQQYAQPKIVEFIQMGYTTLFDMRFWDNYTVVNQYDLDGVTGKTTQDLTTVLKRFQDFQYLWLDGFNQPLPRIPNNRAPSMVFQPSFTTSADPKCLFKVIPVTTTGKILVRLRTIADLPFKETDDVPMDGELLTRWASYMYASSDNANTTLISVLQSLYTERLGTLMKQEDQHAKSLYSYDTQTIDEWHDA
jgi:hypothetical protein